MMKARAHNRVIVYVCVCDAELTNVVVIVGVERLLCLSPVRVAILLLSRAASSTSCFRTILTCRTGSFTLVVQQQ